MYLCARTKKKKEGFLRWQQIIFCFVFYHSARSANMHDINFQTFLALKAINYCINTPTSFFVPKATLLLTTRWKETKWASEIISDLMRLARVRKVSKLCRRVLFSSDRHVPKTTKKQPKKKEKKKGRTRSANCYASLQIG